MTDDMTFQYFFFDTYVGYFLQVLPIALAASIVYGAVKYRNDKETALVRKLFDCIFICYMTGLVCLVAAIKVIGAVWYRLIYHMESGTVIHPFAWDINLVPDFFTHFGLETLGNLLMFLPFGVLYPLSGRDVGWRKTICAGFVCSVIIEILQPIFGRAFDVNDIILNTLGVFLSATLYFILVKAFCKKGRFTDS